MDAADIADILAPAGPVRCRRMFGGHGIYQNGVMIALEAAGEIYLKADMVTEPQFRAAGSRPFTYEKNGRAYAMSYWLLPEAALDDAEELVLWVARANEAARRGAARR